MDAHTTFWLWVTGLGAAGGVLSAALRLGRDHRHGGPPHGGRTPRGRGAPSVLRASLVAGSAVSAGATAWLVGATAAPSDATLSSAVVYLAAGFATAEWLGTVRDNRLLRRAVHRAAMLPAAHPDAVADLARGSADAVLDAVTALVPERLRR
jgi:hypothetical protein